VTVVRRGTLTADLSSVDNALPVNAGYALEGGTLRIVGRAAGESVQSFAPANVAQTNVSGTGTGAGTATFNVQGGNIVGDNNGGTLVVSLPNTLTRTTGGSIDFAAVGSGVTKFLTGVANSNGILGGATSAYATMNGVSWAVQSGGQVTGLAASGYNTAAGHLDVPAGTVPIAGGTVAATARFNAAGGTIADLAGGTSTLSQGGLLVTAGVGAAPTLIRNGTIATGGNELFVHQHNTSGSLEISAVIGGTQSVVKAGAGRLILSGANTATGSTHINQGTLQVGAGGCVGALPTGAIVNDGALVIARTDGTAAVPFQLATGNAITGAGTVTVQAGNGWVNFNRVNHGYTGATTISSGYVQSLVNGSLQAAPVILGDANTGSQPVALVSNHIAVTNYNYPVIVPADGGTGPVIIGSSGGSGAVAAIYNGTMEFNRPVILTGQHPDRTTFTNSITGNVGTLTIDVLDAGGNPLLPGVTPPASTLGSRRITWEGTNSFVGNVEIRNGSTLQIGLGTAGVFRDQIPDASDVSLFGTNSTLQFNYEGEVINNLNGEVGTVVRSIATGGGHMVLSVNGGIFNGAVDGGSGMYVEKNGSGLLVLGGTADNNTARLRVNDGAVLLDKTVAGAKAVAADLTINGGTVQLAGTTNDQIWDGTVVTVNGGTLDLGGRNERISVLQGLGGRVVNDAGGTTSTIEIGDTNNAATSVYFGSIADGAGVVRVLKNNVVAHGLVLAGDNSYSGGTQVDAGVLQVGNGGTSGSAGTGTVALAANTRIVIDRSDDFTLPNDIGGAGSFTHQGRGVVSVTGSNSYSGVNTINDGAVLSVGAGGTSGSVGTGNISNFGELRFNRIDSITLTQSIADLPTDTGMVRQVGAGRTILTGVSNYYGDTRVEAGVLEVDGALRTTRTTVTGSGTLSGDGSVADVVMDGGTLAPGGRIGKLMTSSVTTVSPTSAFAFEIGGLSEVSGHDQVETTGSVALGDGVLAVQLVDGYIPAFGDKFLIWLNDGADSVATYFAGLSEGASFAADGSADPDDRWLISYVEGSMAGSSGNDISITYVPEPSVALTAGGALLALGMRRRRA
jgi:autotransporter-associated beta strand protein